MRLCLHFLLWGLWVSGAGSAVSYWQVFGGGLIGGATKENEKGSLVREGEEATFICFSKVAKGLNVSDCWAGGNFLLIMPQNVVFLQKIFAKLVSYFTIVVIIAPRKT